MSPGKDSLNPPKDSVVLANMVSQVKSNVIAGACSLDGLVRYLPGLDGQESELPCRFPSPCEASSTGYNSRQNSIRPILMRRF